MSSAGGSIRCGIAGLTGPGRKRTKAIIQDRPINKLEKFIAMSRRYRCHLIRWRRWLIGRFSSGTSSTMRLRWLSLPAIGFGWIYRREEENCYRVYEGGEVQRIEAVASVDVFEAEAFGWYL